MTDIAHFSQKVRKHKGSKAHMSAVLNLAMLGRRASIANQLADGCLGVRKYNEEVRKNRHILELIIDCVKFCGSFELALRGHDETPESLNPGVFRGNCTHS